MGFLSTLRVKSDEQFQTWYLKTTEKEWSEMTATHLAEVDKEVARRGLTDGLEDEIGEVMLPHVRYAKHQFQAMRPALNAIKMLGEITMETLASPEDHQDRLMLTRLANDPRHPLTPDQVETVMALTHEQRVTYINGDPASSPVPTPEDSLPEASTGSTGTLNAQETAPGAGSANVTARPSIGASAGVPTGAESGFDVVAYRRLPLQAKRDAFIDNGFLYVRTAVLRSWMAHLTQGKCCRPQREDLGHHASDCWLRDAVR